MAGLYALLPVVFALFMGVLWCLGLGIFVTEVTTLEEPRISSSLQPTDAIVVLTGGSERVSAGIELLKAGVAKKLFISGVYQATSTDHLTGIQSLDKDQRACCVILGHVADSTLGNRRRDPCVGEERKYSFRAACDR